MPENLTANPTTLNEDGKSHVIPTSLESILPEEVSLANMAHLLYLAYKPIIPSLFSADEEVVRGISQNLFVVSFLH